MKKLIFWIGVLIGYAFGKSGIKVRFYTEDEEL